MSAAGFDLDDPRLAPYRIMRAGDRVMRAGADATHFVAEGALAVERLLASRRFVVDSLVCTPAQRDKLASRLPADLPVFIAEREQLAALTGFDFHRGVLACARRPPMQTRLAPESLAALRGRERLTILVAVGLADPRNLGALIRNAAAFAVDLVIADRRGADLFARLTIRASVGNVFRVPVQVADDLPGLIADLRQDLDLEVLAATPAGERVLGQFARPPRLLLLLGNEGEGLPAAMLAAADARVQIPIAAGADSINVAAAAAVLLYALG